MNPLVHSAGSLYCVMDGVRRAKAAQMHGHTAIRAEVIDAKGQSLGEAELPLEALRSPKTLIRRITTADETRWNRAVAGAKLPVLNFPPLTVQPCTEQGSKIEDIGFDFGGNP